jgi:acyl-ACP thioesterase
MISGLSEWCCLDYTTRALRRSNSIKYPNLEMVETKNNNISFTNLKVDVDKKDFVYTRTIMPTDIDVNLHTNNLKYTNIALDALSLEELQTNFIKEYEIYFANETKVNDKIDVYKKKVKGYYYIEGKREEQTIFRVVLKFSKKK